MKKGLPKAIDSSKIAVLQQTHQPSNIHNSESHTGASIFKSTKIKSGIENDGSDNEGYNSLRKHS